MSNSFPFDFPASPTYYCAVRQDTNPRVKERAFVAPFRFDVWVNGGLGGHALTFRKGALMQPPNPRTGIMRIHIVTGGATVHVWKIGAGTAASVGTVGLTAIAMAAVQYESISFMTVFLMLLVNCILYEAILMVGAWVNQQRTGAPRRNDEVPFNVRSQGSG